MGIDFKIQDFAYPLSIYMRKAAFDKNQWLSEKCLRKLQIRRFRRILEHANKYVPYYRELLSKIRLCPADITTIEDMKSIPYLTKDIIRTEGNRLLAENSRCSESSWITTSGTTGGQVRLCMDKSANVMEFAYYWRLFGWMGYRLHDRFAELSAEQFERGTKLYGRLCHLEPFTNRLMLNSLLVSGANASGFVDTFELYRPRFLKGLPSNLSCLASVLLNSGVRLPHLNAVFSVGENLLAGQRQLVEQVFTCPVIDCYGHMERTVAISQCPYGAYHVHSDYGIAEFVEPETPPGISHDPAVFEIVGTSLYNWTMPLIRYRTGDLVLLKNTAQPCPCGREFPVVDSIIGRSADVVVTRNGRYITALYTALDKTSGITCGQIVQESLSELSARIAVDPGAECAVDDELRANIRNLTGDSMNIQIKRMTVDEVRGNNAAKFKVVVSLLPHTLSQSNYSVGKTYE